MPIYITGAVEQWDEFHRLFFILAAENTFPANDLLKGTSFTFHSGKNMISVLTGAKTPTVGTVPYDWSIHVFGKDAQEHSLRNLDFQFRGGFC